MAKTVSLGEEIEMKPSEDRSQSERRSQTLSFILIDLLVLLALVLTYAY